MPFINRTGGGGSNVKFISTSDGSSAVPAVKNDVEIPELTANASDVYKGKIAFVNEGFAEGALELVSIEFYNYDRTWLGAISVKVGDCTAAVNDFASGLKDPDAVNYYSTNSSYPLTNLGGYKFGGWIPFTEDAIVVPSTPIIAEATEFPSDYFFTFSNVTENIRVIAAFHECSETLGGGIPPIGRYVRYDIAVGAPSVPAPGYQTIGVRVTISKKQLGRYWDPDYITATIDERRLGHGQACRIFSDLFKGKKLPLTLEFQERAADVIDRQVSNGYSVSLTTHSGISIASSINLGASSFFTPFTSLEIETESGAPISSVNFSGEVQTVIVYVAGKGSNENAYHKINMINPSSLNAEFVQNVSSRNYKLTLIRPDLSAGQSAVLTFKDNYYPDSGVFKTLDITVSD